MHSCLKHTDWPQKASRHRSCLASTHSTTATKAYLHLLFVSLIELTPLERSKTKAQPISFLLLGLMPFGRTAKVGFERFSQGDHGIPHCCFSLAWIGFHCGIVLPCMPDAHNSCSVPQGPCHSNVAATSPTNNNGTTSWVGMRH